VLSGRVDTLISAGLGGASSGGGSGDVGLADFADAPPAVRELISISYGDATGRIFLVSAVIAVVALASILFIREIALSTSSGDQRLREETADQAV